MFFKKSGSNVDAIIVGLGNPGIKYAPTRHNVGFGAIDYIADKLGTDVNKLKFEGLYSLCNIKDKRVLLLKPQTFMNESGKSVGAFASFYKVSPQNVIVIFDDVSLDVGKMRIRKKGSAGGHNGIKSVIAHLSSEDFPRVKIGVGKKPHPDYDLADWVLGALPLKDREIISENNSKVYDAVCDILNGDFEKAMGKYN